LATGNVQVAMQGSAERGFAVSVGWPGRTKLRLMFPGKGSNGLLRLAATGRSGARYGFAAMRLH
jgi:hypothetical protein